MALSWFSRLDERRTLYSLSSSRKDLGVVYTCLFRQEHTTKGLFGHEVHNQVNHGNNVMFAEEKSTHLFALDGTSVMCDHSGTTIDKHSLHAKLLFFIRVSKTKCRRHHAPSLYSFERLSCRVDHFERQREEFLDSCSDPIRTQIHF